jgi:Zn-dependent M28 family amino/carboxypeptidase
MARYTPTWTPATPVTQTPSFPALTQIPELTPAAANGQIAHQHLAALADDIGARIAGSPEEAEAARYIRTAFDSLGYETQVQPFSFKGEIDGKKISGDSANVIAIKEGLTDREIIIGAHYDSVDDGDGADDNASGVAVLLEAAAMIRNIQTPYTLRFIAFGAEETGLNGSYYYVEQMSKAEIDNTLDMINLDSLVAGDIAYVYGDAGTPHSLRDWILDMAHAYGFELEGETAQDMIEEDGSPCDCSDYAPFEDVGITYAYFEATNWNVGDKDGWTQVDPRYGDNGQIWHTQFDTISQIEGLFPGRIDQHLGLFATLLYKTLTEFQ